MKYILGGPLRGPINNIIPKRKIQEKQEEIAYRINDKLGDAVSKVNRFQNKAEEISDNIERTIWNAMDSAFPMVDLFRKYLAPEVKEINIGDHLYVQRTGYTHHGLYYGNGQVIHYLKESVVIDSIEIFAKNSVVLKKSYLDSPSNYSEYEIISRAESRLGENRYNLIYNNCEHFVRWCRCGE